MLTKAFQGVVLLCGVAFISANSVAGMVAFFDVPDARKQCPDGWSEYGPAKGRLIVGTTNGDEVGRAVGEPMADRTAPTHTHGFTAGVTLDYEPVVANGGPNKSLTAAGVDHTTRGTTGESDGNMPYMQLLACEQREGFAAEDALPREMVAFFAQGTCPANWEPYEPLNGRFAVPMPPGGTLEATVGPWNANMTHDHYMYVSDAAADEKIYLPVANASVALAKHWWPFKVNKSYGKRTFPDRFYRTDDSADMVPRVSLLACQRIAGRARSSKLPADIMAFMTAADCPKHWRQKPASMGRFLVGLPTGQYAQSGIPFGGNPLRDKEIREHLHSVQTELNLPSHGIAGASGCCSNDYAAAGTYTMQGQVKATLSTYPYVQLRHCIVTPAVRKSGNQ